MNTFTKLFLIGSLMIGANAVQAAPAKMSPWYKAGILSAVIGSNALLLAGIYRMYDIHPPQVLENVWNKVTIPSFLLAGILGSLGILDTIEKKEKAADKEQE